LLRLDAAGDPLGLVDQFVELGASRREAEIARLLSLGCSMRQVAAILHVSYRTVDGLKTRIKWKLGTIKAGAVTRFIIKTGISSLEDELTSEERKRLKRA
jgi:DNA-binding CsgD family transcriptional regulator